MFFANVRENYFNKVGAFLDPNGTRFARCPFRAQKSLDFKARPFQWASKLDFPASKSLRPAPYKQQVH